MSYHHLHHCTITSEPYASKVGAGEMAPVLLQDSDCHRYKPSFTMTLTIPVISASRSDYTICAREAASISILRREHD
jgi:hypothetical protein